MMINGNNKNEIVNLSLKYYLTLYFPNTWRKNQRYPFIDEWQRPKNKLNSS